MLGILDQRFLNIRLWKQVTLLAEIRCVTLCKVAGGMTFICDLQWSLVLQEKRKIYNLAIMN